jgi:hypothetical protein
LGAEINPHLPGGMESSALGYFRLTEQSLKFGHFSPTFPVGYNHER